MSIFYKNKKGFTLIELLVVIAVIGVLSSIVLVSLSGARDRARDAIRKSDMSQIRKALEVYWSTYEHYPPEGLCCDTSVGANPIADYCWVGCQSNPPGDYWDANSDLQDLVTADITSVIPVDPINDATYGYWYEPDNIGQGVPPCQVNSCRYVLCCRLETGGNYCVHSLEKGS
ncbi:type II secretion system protein [Candidatus Parcubacteria bacterium]|nr:type II secretion system protein [Candidatus Parcubacteria bacterium]